MELGHNPASGAPLSSSRLLAAASATIGNLILAAAGGLVDAAALGATIADLTFAATGTVIVSAALGATIDPITLAAAGAVVVSSGDGVYPWWWHQYVARHEAEREAARLKWRDEHRIEGDGYYVMLPRAHGQAIHDPDEADMAALAAACLWLLAA